MGFAAVIAIAAIIAGAIAAVAGFGIGSILTPVAALQTDTRIAVAAVSIPHLLGTAVRFWRLRRYVDHALFLTFGVPSAAGGMIGALLHGYASGPILTVVFGALLVFAGFTGLTGLAQKMRFGPRAAYVAGAASGALGGFVGNQGSIRSAAMLGFNIHKEAFVATATAIALVVDAVRMPVYFVTEWKSLTALWIPITIASAGVLAGTLGGEKVLRRIPEPLFRRLVSFLLLGLGLFVLLRLKS
jgi:uncharacterized membrane protein YfcA